MPFYAFCFILSGFYNFSITLSAASCGFYYRFGVFFYNANTLNFGCVLFDFWFKFKMHAESFLSDTLTEFNFTLTASPKFLPTA